MTRDPIPVLSVQQPWLWAITHAAAAPEHHKPVENRTWYREYRGPLWLHASSRYAGEADASPLIVEALRAYVATLGLDETRGLKVRNLMEFGALVAQTTITGWHHADDCRRPDGGMCSRWAMDDQFHIVLGPVRQLPRPLGCSGRLGLWYLPDAIEFEARAQLAAAA